MDCQELRHCVAPLSPSPHVLCLMMSSAMRASLWLSAFAAPDLFALFSGSRGPGAPDPSLVHVFLLQPSCDIGWQTDFSCAGLQRATSSAANSVLTCCSIREQAGQEVMPSADVLVNPTVALVLGAFGSLDGSGPWRM